MCMCKQPGSGCPDIEECKIGVHVVKCSCLPAEKVGEKSAMQMRGSDVKYAKKLEQARLNKDLKEQAALRKKEKGGREV